MFALTFNKPFVNFSASAALAFGVVCGSITPLVLYKYYDVPVYKEDITAKNATRESSAPSVLKQITNKVFFPETNSTTLETSAPDVAPTKVTTSKKVYDFGKYATKKYTGNLKYHSDLVNSPEPNFASYYLIQPQQCAEDNCWDYRLYNLKTGERVGFLQPTDVNTKTAGTPYEVEFIHEVDSNLLVMKYYTTGMCVEKEFTVEGNVATELYNPSIPCNN